MGYTGERTAKPSTEQESVYFTRVPNALIDRAPDLTGIAFKLAILIARETIGWRREWAELSSATLTRRLGASERATTLAAQELEKYKIAEVKRPTGKVAQYRLTPYEKCGGAKNVGGEENDRGTENCAPAENVGTPPQKTTGVPPTKIAPPYKEERNSLKKGNKRASSSSVPPEAATRTTPPSSQSASQKPEAEADPRWWQRYDRQNIQERLNAAKTFGSMLQFPTWRETETILADNFDSADDFVAWVESLRFQDMRAAKFWSFYRQPAEGWRSKRAGYHAEIEAERERNRAWMERQAAEAARVVDVTPQQEWCAACAAEQPCERHGTGLAEPKPAGREPAGDLAYRRQIIVGDLEFQKSMITREPNARMRKWTEEKIAQLEAQLAELDSDPSVAEGAAA